MYIVVAGVKYAIQNIKDANKNLVIYMKTPTDIHKFVDEVSFLNTLPVYNDNETVYKVYNLTTDYEKFSFEYIA